MIQTAPVPLFLVAPHAASPEQLAQELNTHLQRGLPTDEITERQQKWGRNQLAQQKKKSLFFLFLRQFSSPITYLLLAAATLSFLFREWLDGAAIVLVTLINAGIGFFMEFNAGKSMEALRQMALVPAKVIRDGKVQEISSEDVVPGDVLLLEAGDLVPADARLFLVVQLEINESALTGESLPVSKQEDVLPTQIPTVEKTNMVFKGSYVTKGNAHALVTGIGSHTELGQVATLLQTADQGITPLEKKLEVFSHKLLKVTIVLCIIVILAGLWQDRSWTDSLGTAIALAVAAIPEGLSIVVTLALAQGMLRMAKYQVIVKKLSAVETLGGTNVICTDKTGTLTKNEIEVNTLLVPGMHEPVKAEALLHQQLPATPSAYLHSGQDDNVHHILRAAVLCNTAYYTGTDSKAKGVGDPVEVGLLKFAQSAGMELENLRQQLPKLAEESFTSETKVMGTLHQLPTGAILYAKGALEELLLRCTQILQDGKISVLTPEKKTYWKEQENQLAQQGQKVLAFAYKETAFTHSLSMDGLVFLGLAGMLDPPREDVKNALAECRSAGICVKMITGDHPSTARNIAAQVGITNGQTDSIPVVHGAQMPGYAALTTAQKQQWLEAPIFARVSPKQKLDLVALLQANQMVVGMTGDGVNDAPALQKADIGIAMGIRGTQVAQEAADMVLKDDSFSSIVLAIKQGRIIFDNIRKFVVFMLSCNLSELLVVTMISLLAFQFQLLPIQILFINLITDVLPALALGAGPGNPDIMLQKPRHLEEPILQHAHWVSLVAYAAVIAMCVLGAVSFGHQIVYENSGAEAAHANNILFLTLILCQLWHVFNMGNKNISFLKNEVVTNPYVWYALLACGLILLLVFLVPPLAAALAISPINLLDVGVAMGFSVLSFFFIYLLRKGNVIL
jgi:Ca2+-transporting ATPase